jgi:signal transduction histidine kinase
MILDYYKDQLQDRDLVEMLKDINASSIRLISIVNDFLNVSRLEQKKMEFKKESFDVIFLINQVFQELQSMKNQNVEVRVENGDGKAPRVLADPDKTKEVLINLIGNALKFTEHGEVVVSIFAENSSFKIFVRDTGRGITPQYQSLLFRKFQQAGESLFTRDTTKGTGLGLYISKLLVEGMGGQIWLERSEAGKGTVFGFTLPSGN